MKPDRFGHSNLPGEVVVTVTQKKVSCCTEVSNAHEVIPDVTPPEMCYFGRQKSLVLLAKLVEAEIVQRAYPKRAG